MTREGTQKPRGVPPVELQKQVEQIERQVRELRERLTVDTAPWNAANDALRALDQIRIGIFRTR